MVMYQHCEVLTSVQKTLHCENDNDLVGVLIYNPKKSRQTFSSYTDVSVIP